MHDHGEQFTLMILLFCFCEVVTEKLIIRRQEENCELWVPKDFKNLKENEIVTVGSPSLSVSYIPVQIGLYVKHTQWMNFMGCTLRHHDGSCTFKLRGEIDPIVECYEYCNKATFFTHNGCCYCTGYNTTTQLCPAKHCFDKYSGLCGESHNDQNSACFCEYQPISINVAGEYENCLKIYHSAGQSIGHKSEHCHNQHLYLGVPQKEFDKASWWEAALKVQKDLKHFANGTYLQNSVRLKPNTNYWVGTFRKHILTAQRPNKTENYCGTILRTSDGNIRFNIKTCNYSSLQKLCIVNDESNGNFPQTPMTPSITPTRISMTGPTEDCTASNKCTTTDPLPTEHEDGINTTGNIVIICAVIVVILVIISFGIFCVQNRKSSMESVASGSTEFLPAPKNIYISQSAMRENRREAAPIDNNYSEVCFEDEIADIDYNASNMEQINTAQNKLRKTKNDDPYDSFGNGEKDMQNQDDISNSNYDRVARVMKDDAYDVFERDDDVTISDYDQMGKVVNNEYDTFNKKPATATDVNNDYDHVQVTEEDQSRTSV